MNAIRAFNKIRTIDPQVYFLLGSMAGNLVLGVIISTILTDYLGPIDYGRYGFIRTIFTVLPLLTGLGIYNVLAKKISSHVVCSKQHEEIWNFGITYATLQGGVVWFFLMILGVVAFYVDLEISRETIWLLSPIALVVAFRSMYELTMEGVEKKFGLILLRFLPRAFFLIIIFFLSANFDMDLRTVVYMEWLTITGMLIYLFSKFRKFKLVRKSFISEIKIDLKNYGFKIYLSILIATGTSYIVNFILPLVSNFADLGFFLLALTLTQPLTMVPNVMASINFPDFTGTDKPRTAVYSCIVFSLLALILYLLFVPSIISVLYTVEFQIVKNLSYFLAIQALIHGLGDFFNKYLCAQGAGNKVLKGSYILAVINLLSVSLVYYYGLYGAVMTKCISSAIYLVVMLIFYRNQLKYNEARSLLQ